ncbi:MAG: Ig-like domain-containing protein, partial [Verrucomicrobiales bacterium]|nr:Ig-like domain-containing protein [Verrucomicrobiales bacterium]
MSQLTETLRVPNAPPGPFVRGEVHDIAGQRSEGDFVPVGTSRGGVALAAPLVTTVSGSLSTNTIWSGTVHVTQNVTVPAGVTLTIQPGTVVKVAQGQFLSVVGTLDARGTESQAIIFTSHRDDSVGEDVSGAGQATPSRGDWESLYFDDTSDASVLENVEVRYAGNPDFPTGGNRRPALVLRNSNVTLRNLLVMDVQSTGIALESGSATLDRVTVQRAAGRAFDANLAATPASLTALTARESGLNGYVLSGGTIDANRTWDFGGLAVHLISNITVAGGATLTLVPGQVVKFDQGIYLAANSGTLRAVGEVTRPIVFTASTDDTAGGDSNADGNATQPVQGSWEAIYLQTGSGASVLENVEVRFAGNPDFPTGGNRVPSIVLEATDATLRNVLVRDAHSFGVGLRSGSPILANVSVVRAGNAAFNADLVVTPVLQDLAAAETPLNGYRLGGGTIQDNRTWDFGGLSVHVTGNITVSGGGTLTIIPGQVLKMNTGLYLAVNGGTVKAIGTETQPIIFTSQHDDSAGGDTNANGEGTAPVAGDWEALYLQAGSNASELAFIEVRYAGNPDFPTGGNRVPALTFENTSAIVRNALIRDVQAEGVRFEGGQPTLNKIHVTRAARTAFVSDLAANPSLTELTAVANGVDAFQLTGGSLPGDRVWNIITMPYVFTDDLRVPQGVKLEIRPGVVLKFTNGQWFAVNGTLEAPGTLAEPIIFTGRRDDSALGDTFQDGSTGNAAPVAGNWEAFYLQAGSIANLDHVDIRYAGNPDFPTGGNRTASLLITDASPVIRNTRVLNSQHHGLEIQGDSKPLLEQVHIENAQREAAVIQISADPQLRGLTGRNNAQNRVFIDGTSLPGDRTFSTGGSGALPIQLSGNFRVSAGRKLTIGPGQVIKMGQGNWFAVNGVLEARGTAAEPIIFTSHNDDSAGGDSNGNGAQDAAVPGSWEALYFETGSDASVLENAEVRFAGNPDFPTGGNRVAAVVFDASNATMRKVRILNVQSDGIEFTSGTPTLQSVQITGAGRYALTGALTSVPVLQDINTGGNAVDAYFLRGVSIGSSRTWDLVTLPYVFQSNLRVGTGVTLTLKPGVTFKFAHGDWFAVNGTLDARGTVAQPIVFTSYDDDTAGGDTFHNGDAVPPVPGKWEGLYFEAPGGAHQIDYVEVRYAGNPDFPTGGNRVAAVYVEVPVTARHFTVRHSQQDGINVRSGGALTLDDSIIANSGRNGLFVENGTATVTDTAFFAAPTGIQINSGHSVNVSGSSFTNLQMAVRNAGTDFAKAVAVGNWWSHAGGPNDSSAADGRQNANPDGLPVSDFVDYGSFLTVPPGLTVGPFILSHTPALTNTSLASLDVVFSEPIDLTTFGPEDIASTGPQAGTVTSITLVSGTTYRINFTQPLDATGTYQVRVGPNISAPSGFVMDQDRDGTTGEATADAYTATVILDVTGGRVLSHTPVSTQATPIGSITLTFSEAIAASSFTPADVAITGPNGAIQPLAVTPLSPTQFRVNFAVQAANGDYTLLIGPNISDLAGNALDQNQNGINGEAEPDRYTATFTVARQPLRIIAQDPVAAVLGVLDHIDVTFSAPIDANSFNAADARLQGPAGIATATAITLLAPDRFRIVFAPVTTEGTYRLIVGPEITDPAAIFMDQDGDGIAGEPEDRYESTFRVDNVGPVIRDISVKGTVAAPVSFIDLIFSEAITPGSFTAADVAAAGPGGAVAVLSVSSVTATTYRVTVEPLRASGDYTVTVGPNIADAGGTLMDQDLDGTGGEATQDQFAAQFTIDASGPRVTNATPTGEVTQPFNQVTLEFSEAILESSFTVADVRLTASAGEVAATGLTRLSATSYRVTFPAQSTVGNYTLVVGPQITDLVG